MALFPFSAKPDNRRLPFGGNGHILGRYKNESMVLAAPGSDYPDLASKMRLFDLQLANVYNRLCLEIVGPTDPGEDIGNPRLHLHQDPFPLQAHLEQRQRAAAGAVGRAFIELSAAREN